MQNTVPATALPTGSKRTPKARPIKAGSAPRSPKTRRTPDVTETAPPDPVAPASPAPPESKAVSRRATICGLCGHAHRAIGWYVTYWSKRPCHDAGFIQWIQRHADHEGIAFVPVVSATMDPAAATTPDAERGE